MNLGVIKTFVIEEHADGHVNVVGDGTISLQRGQVGIDVALNHIQQKGYEVGTPVLLPTEFRDAEKRPILVWRVVAKQVRRPLTEEENLSLRAEIIGHVAEIQKGPPFEHGAEMREFELKLRHLQTLLNSYFDGMPVEETEPSTKEQVTPDRPRREGCKAEPYGQ